jgi:hypothetical protein
VEAFAWPAAVVVMVVVFMLLFHRPLLARVRVVHRVNWKEGLVEFRGDEVDEALWMLSELEENTSDITPAEILKLKQIMSSPSGRYQVCDHFPAFARAETNASSKTLRKLRDAQFIRPQEGGAWKENKQVEIKRFGELVWRKLGDTLFKQRDSADPSTASGE